MEIGLGVRSNELFGENPTIVRADSDVKQSPPLASSSGARHTYRLRGWEGHSRLCQVQLGNQGMWGVARQNRAVRAQKRFVRGGSDVKQSPPLASGSGARHTYRLRGWEGHSRLCQVQLENQGMLGRIPNRTTAHGPVASRLWTSQGSHFRSSPVPSQ